MGFGCECGRRGRMDIIFRYIFSVVFACLSFTVFVCVVVLDCWSVLRGSIIVCVYRDGGRAVFSLDFRSFWSIYFVVSEFGMFFRSVGGVCSEFRGEEEEVGF